MELKSAVEMLSSAAIPASVSASDVRHDTDPDTNVFADGNANQQLASLSPALQQGTAVPSNTDFNVSRDAKNASSLASVAASDVSKDADTNVSADGNANQQPASVSPTLHQGTVVPNNTDLNVSRDAMNASSLASVSASDVSKDADTNVSADGNAFVFPAATTERYAEISAASCLQLLRCFVSRTMTPKYFRILSCDGLQMAHRCIATSD